MTSRQNHHRPTSGSSNHNNRNNNNTNTSIRSPTYTTLSTLISQLRTAKIKERRLACKQILATLNNNNSNSNLEWEAQVQFDLACRNHHHGGGGGGDGTPTYPRERVSILYRNLMEASLLSSRMSIDGTSGGASAAAGGGGGGGNYSRQRKIANSTGYITKKCKFTKEDILFPQQVFLAIDNRGKVGLEVHDGVLGYSNTNSSSSSSSTSGGGSEGDWKTRSRFGHHLASTINMNMNTTTIATTTTSSSSQQQQFTNHGHFSATHYNSYNNASHSSSSSDQNHNNNGGNTSNNNNNNNNNTTKTHLSSKEIISTTNYIIDCLNDDDCVQLAEFELLQWLAHICARPEYVAYLPVHFEVSYILNEVGVRLNRAFDDVVGASDGNGGGKRRQRGGDGYLFSPHYHDNNHGNNNGNKNKKSSPVSSQQCLLTCAKCLSALIYQCTTRLGIGMHLYLRPVIEMVAIWAENAWMVECGGGGVGIGDKSTITTAAAAAAAATTTTTILGSEARIASLLPYMYSCVTHLLAAHPEQSVAVLSDHGHALLRLARRNYAKGTTNSQTREALTEYISAHLLVAETSGKLFGLVEGDLGPLVPREEEDYDDDDDNDDDGSANNDGNEGRNDRGSNHKKRRRKKGVGATLDKKWINSLLEMVRSEKVWESLFSETSGGGGAMGEKKKRKAGGRNSMSGRKRGGIGGLMNFNLSEGGGVWTPLNRRQRRHLELMTRLLRVAQRLYLADAEATGDGSHDPLESMIEDAEETRRSSGIEQGEIDIEQDGHGPQSSSSENDSRHVATSDALACSPWIRMISRHLYELNPKIGQKASLANGSLTQDTATFSIIEESSSQFLTQQHRSGSDSLPNRTGDSATSCEYTLFKSCPMLQALIVENRHMASTTLTSTEAPALSSTQYTTNTNAMDAHDSIRPTLVATLQLICACAEAFPRGECWTSSTRRYWSTVLDERNYPGGTSARILERHGSSPADAAAIVYLLGTTLESCGGSGGEDYVQVWTLVALLKMAESSAIICCSREGLADAASFGSPSALGALRVAWQYVWKVLFRYDLRYSSYTSCAYANNAGELVVQLLTQIIRYQCVDRTCLLNIPFQSLLVSEENSEKGPNMSSTASADCPFVHSEQGSIWKLPVFENASSVISGAPFELITSVVQFSVFSETVNDSNTALALHMRLGGANSVRDRKWFISFCLRFIEVAMGDAPESIIRRAFLPCVGTCLAALISDGVITSNMSSFELDSLTRFGLTEDTEPAYSKHQSDDVIAGASNNLLPIYDALWAESIMPNDGLKDMCHGLSQRILQGRGAFLNTLSDSKYEREYLLRFMTIVRSSGIESAVFSQKDLLGDMALASIKSCFEELYQFRYAGDDDDGGESQDDSAQSEKNKLAALPRMTGCLSLILTVLLSKYSNAKDFAKSIADISADTFIPTFDLLLEKLSSLSHHSPPDFAAVFSHLHGIFRVLTYAAAVGGGGVTIPQIFRDHSNSFFSSCRSLLKEYRRGAYTSRSTNANPTSTPGLQRHLGFDSDDDDIAESTMQSQRIVPKSGKFVDSDDSMDVEDRTQRAPPLKRRRMANTSSSVSKKNLAHINAIKSIDRRGAWSCASLMVLLHPSMKCLEAISSHLVWPEDFNNENGYDPVSVTPETIEALFCVSLFCRKSVILRRDLLLDFAPTLQTNDDPQSALILSIEVILQARRYASQSSPFFMSGFGMIANLVEIADYGGNHFSMSTEESEAVVDALYPEGCGQKNEDYRLLRQLKKTLKSRTFYRSEQLRIAISVFLFAQKNLHTEFDSSFADYFVKSAIHHIDENVRSFACDALGAALTAFPNQEMIVSEMVDKVLPPLSSGKKFKKWLDSLCDPKIPDDLTRLEQASLDDARLSIEFHAVECIGLIAGSTSESVCKEMIWKLINIACTKPSLALQCRRACERAAFLLGFRNVGDLFDHIVPHVLVKWIESHRDLWDFPLLLTSPCASKGICRYFPNEVLTMFLTGGGWNDDFWRIEEVEGEYKTLNERVLSAFIQSVASFLIPIILLSASGDAQTHSSGKDHADAMKYITDCALILAGGDSDEDIAKILRFHVRDIFGFVFVLQSDTENTAIQDQCHYAVKLLQRCVSESHIQREGAKQAFVVLRRILMLHWRGCNGGIPVVGHGEIKLTPESFIEGMKCVSRQLKKPPSNHCSAGFLEPAGSSITECIVLVKYWLSTSLNSRQREDACGTFSLLCVVLQEHIEDGTIQSPELRFCLHSFIAIALDPENSGICPSILESLKGVIRVLFSNLTMKSLVEETVSTLHKLCLALLQIHERTFIRFRRKCSISLACLQFDQKLSHGILPGFDGVNSSLDETEDVLWDASHQHDDLLIRLISSKADLEEKLLSDTLIGAFECLEIVATSGKLVLEDIMGADDVAHRFKSDQGVFRDVNKKFSIESLFKLIQQSPTKTLRNIESECTHFMRIMREHPISNNQFNNDTHHTIAQSIDALARFLALQRLEKVLLLSNGSCENFSSGFQRDVYCCLLNICHSGDPEEARIIASRCLGEMKNVEQLSDFTSLPDERSSISKHKVNESLGNPLLAIKTKSLAMLGQFLLSDCAKTSFVAMKTAKALLVTQDGKDCWESLDEDVKGILKPFVATDDSSLRKEAVGISSLCLERLKGLSGVSLDCDDDSWCWNDGLWTCIDGGDISCELWIKNTVCSIISCCYGRSSQINRDGQDFFLLCIGLCAKEASFASCIFPAIVFHLLNSETRDNKYDRKNDSVRDIILSKTAIGSPTGEMNDRISNCFSRLLLTKTGTLETFQDLQMNPQAVTVVLNTLELLRAVTEHRFLSSPDHVKNTSNLPQNQNPSSSRKRRPRNSTDSSCVDKIDGSTLSSLKWRGFPYGIVLRLDGLDVAKACFHLKRYYSAIYYAEMGMQNLIGVGNFFEEVASNSRFKQNDFSINDISGFGIFSQSKLQQKGKTMLESILFAKNIIGCCLSELQENDELQGVLAQASALNLKQNITNLNTLYTSHCDQNIPKLVDLDTSLQVEANFGVASTRTNLRQEFVNVSNCLEDMGLNHTKHHYLVGVERVLSKDKESDCSRHFLREKWFEDSLKNTSQWDNSLLPKLNETELASLSYTTPQQKDDEIPGDSRDNFFQRQTPSFYESIHKALQSFVRDDAVGGHCHILQARRSVLADMEALAGSESKLRSLAAHISKLSVLGNLEQTAKTIEGHTTVMSLLGRWGFCNEHEVQNLKSLLLNNDIASLNTTEQMAKIDGGLFRSLATQLSVKEICLKLLMKKSSDHENIIHALTSHVYKSCRIFRELGRTDASRVCLTRLRSLMQSFQQSGIAFQSPKTLALLLHLEDAKIMKCQSDFDTAITHCKMIASHLSSDIAGSVDIDNRQLLSESLLLGGLWMTHQNVDAATTILSSYFQKAAELSLEIHAKKPSDSSIRQASMACFKLGEFAANLYSSADARVDSEVWKKRNNVVAERRRELEVCSAEVKQLEKKASRSKSNNDTEAYNELWIHRETLKREVTMDERETASVNESIKRYLHMAVKSYCTALQLCPPTTTMDVSKHVFQLISLWFKNCQKQETKDIVNEQLKSNIPLIPSYRFVPLTYQLFSRIDEIDSDGEFFQTSLREIVFKICAEHPYHGIAQLVALSNGKRVGSGVSGRHATAYLDNVGDAKVDAAKSILQELRKHGPEFVAGLIGSHELLMDAYINLAMYSTTKIQDKQTEEISFSKCKLDLDVCLIKGGRRGQRNINVTNAPAIITKPPPIRPDAKYGNGKDDPIGTERVAGFEATFDLTLSGIHRPKIVKCIGSKGGIFKQLVKGEDDLRQDAIMQQVFGTVNDLLRREGSNENDFIRNSMENALSSGSSRRLRLVTYGITPLSPASGVLEWVDNTMAFGDFLIDRGRKVGAHSKYHPGEWGYSVCRKHYENAKPESKRKAYDEICENFSPVFRFFFLENFSSSMEAWHTARTSYTRSCAVNSIVGHILGIGDRHTQNILVHTKTGEIVHIDFGIVFEQGKALTTPETVPFRLTRDVVDGMGPSGTEGGFTRAAEATMSVLRKNADALLTILSAVVSDPLYKWNVSPVKARQRQRSHEERDSSNPSNRAEIIGELMAPTSDENRNDSADRAIAKIHEKLQGYEDGTSGEHKTVAGQVKLLINEARDPNNLSVLFSGWTPWI